MRKEIKKVLSEEKHGEKVLITELVVICEGVQEISRELRKYEVKTKKKVFIAPVEEPEKTEEAEE